MATVRRFEFHDNQENSHKFWELHQKGGCYHTEYGRLSGFGRAGSRSRSGQKCDSSYHRATATKMRNGYVEVNPTSSSTTNSSTTSSISPMMNQQQQQQQQQVAPSGSIGLLNWLTL